MQIRCSVCGTESEHAEPVELEPETSDFDTRPQGSSEAILTWVQRCPNCGHCADDLSHAHDGAGGVIRSDEYRALLRSEAYPEKAREFLCYGLLLDSAGRTADAGWAALHAAWVCDDARYEAAARQCRQRAIELWRSGKVAGENFGDGPSFEFALVTDVYRRSGEFENAVVACSEGLEAPDRSPMSERILRAQRAFIDRKDTACHSLLELNG